MDHWICFATLFHEVTFSFVSRRPFRAAQIPASRMVASIKATPEDSTSAAQNPAAFAKRGVIAKTNPVDATTAVPGESGTGPTPPPAVQRIRPRASLVRNLVQGSSMSGTCK